MSLGLPADGAGLAADGAGLAADETLLFQNNVLRTLCCPAQLPTLINVGFTRAGLATSIAMALLQHFLCSRQHRAEMGEEEGWVPVSQKL